MVLNVLASVHGMTNLNNVEVLRRVPVGTQAWFGDEVGAWLSVGHRNGLEWRAAAPRITVATVWGNGGCTWSAGVCGGRLGRGGLMILDALVGHEGVGEEGSDYVVGWIDPAFAAEVAGRPLHFGALDVPPGHPAADAVVAWAAAMVAGLPDRVARLVRLVQALLDLSGPAHAVTDLAARRVRDHMDGHPARPVDLDELAAVADLSRFQLVRRFRRAYGLPPHRYLVQLRLHAAIEEMHAGADVTEAALRAGFADAAHFIRIFRRQNLATPAAWRAAINPARNPRTQ